MIKTYLGPFTFFEAIRNGKYVKLVTATNKESGLAFYLGILAEPDYPLLRVLTRKGEEFQKETPLVVDKLLLEDVLKIDGRGAYYFLIALLECFKETQMPIEIRKRDIDIMMSDLKIELDKLPLEQKVEDEKQLFPVNYSTN
jgi:hypothetical protein